MCGVSTRFFLPVLEPVFYSFDCCVLNLILYISRTNQYLFDKFLFLIISYISNLF